MGGDNFCVIFEENDDVINLIRKRISGIVNGYRGHDITRAYYGAYKTADKDITTGEMCDYAYGALEIAKQRPDKDIFWYDESMAREQEAEAKLMPEICSAMDNGEFTFYLQPKCILQTGKIIGSEALVRWISPEKGFISPGQFIPLLEKNGFITKLDMYVCEEVCRHQRKEKDNNNHVVPVSVNLSRINFYNENLYKEVLGLLAKYELTSDDIKLEITESAYEDNPQDLIMAIHTLQKYGFKVLMDDFGSGYSSLNMLKDCCFDILKIDMKFMDDLEQSERASNIIYTIIQMAKNLEIETVVEGVENEKQYEMLKSMGCDNIQGYYFSKPIPEESFVRRLEKESEMDFDDDYYEDKDTILIIDDSEKNRSLLTGVLSDKYNVIEADEGEDGLHILKKNFSEVSLVICSTDMSQMSGIEILDQIKETSFLKKMPVVMMTAYGDFDNETKAIELGASEVVNLPVNVTLLKKRIENIINISNANKYLHAAFIGS